MYNRPIPRSLRRSPSLLCRLGLLSLLSWLLPAFAQTSDVSVEITGIGVDLLDNVQGNLGLYQQRNHPLLNEALIRRLHRNAPAEIREALEPFGYYRVGVEATLEPRDGGWLARYRVDPGPPVVVQEVRLSITGPGVDDPAFAQWRNDFPLQEGSVLRHKTYEEAKQQLLQIGRERGYFDGRLENHRVVVSLEPYQASIEIEYASGPRYEFGEITLEQSVFREEFVRRYLTFKTGEPYDAGKVLALRRALADSDYFERADVFTQSEQARDGRVPIQIVLVGRKRHRYLAGIGYSTDTGARGRIGYENRRANKLGHRYSGLFRRSEIEESFSARYNVPLSRPITDSLTYSYTWLDEHTETADQTTSSISADLTQQAGSWLRTMGLSFEHDRYRVDESNNAQLLMPSVRWQRVSADDRIATRHGWILTLGLRGAADAVLSSTSFAQGRIDGKRIEGVTERSRLLLRATTGASWTPEFEDLPASQRFFAGGDQSIRGFAYNSLGPTDADGTVVGGRNILVGSTELEYDTSARMAVAVFIDAGNAFDDTSINAQRGAGAGLRWRTPIGAVRLDFAQALTEPGTPWRIHLTLGPDL